MELESIQAVPSCSLWDGLSPHIWDRKVHRREVPVLICREFILSQPVPKCTIAVHLLPHKQGFLRWSAQGLMVTLMSSESG